MKVKLTFEIDFTTPNEKDEAKALAALATVPGCFRRGIETVMNAEVQSITSEVEVLTVTGWYKKWHSLDNLN